MSLLRERIKRYYLGDPSRKDFSENDLPHSRRALFVECLRSRWNVLPGLNLLYMVFALPEFLWTFFCLLSVFIGPTEHTVQTDLPVLVIRYSFWLIPCHIFQGPARAGMMYVLRNWTRDEHSYTWLDFRDAMRANWKQACAIAFFEALVPFLICTSLSFYRTIAVSDKIMFIPFFLSFFILLFWKLCEMLFYMQVVTYRLSVRTIIKNACMMTVMRLPLAALVKLATIIVPCIIVLLILLFQNQALYFLITLFLLSIFILPAFNGFLVASYANSCCEEYLNPGIEGAEINIGLRKKK